MKHLDLFSGIGGFALAASWVWGAEHEVVSFVEIDDYCQRVLKKNWPDVVVCADIRNHRHDGSDIDLITGGFPCQDISFAKTWDSDGENKENGIDGKRSGLWKYLCNTIGTVRPRFAIVENSAAIAVRGLDRVLYDLAQIGYDAEWQTIPCSVFGAPHRRERIFIVAYPNSVRRVQERLFQGRVFSEAIRKAPEWKSCRAIRCLGGKASLPDWFGVDDGIPKEPYENDAITALGNSIAPQVVVPIMRAIKVEQ